MFSDDERDFIYRLDDEEGKKTDMRSSKDLNLGLLNSDQILLATELLTA